MKASMPSPPSKAPRSPLPARWCTPRCWYLCSISFFPPCCSGVDAMAVRGPRLEFAVGAFLFLALASLLVLAIASTNKKFGFGSSSYELTARFTNLRQLRPQAPVKIGGAVVGQVARIQLD